MPVDTIVTTPAIDWQEWNVVRNYVNRTWDPENCPHHSMVGLTGSGKTYLGINGILSLCEHDRVLIIDTKQDDKLLMSTGRPIMEIPRNPWNAGIGHSKDEPRAFWYRLTVNTGRYADARKQVHAALRRVYGDGNWVLYIDEMRDLTGRQRPFLNLGPYVEEIYRKGRSRRVSIVGATQTPVDVPRTFYDQASFAWLGRIRDEQRQKRLLEIGGLTRKELTYISSLKRRQWLLAADNGEYFVRTQVKV